MLGLRADHMARSTAAVMIVDGKMQYLFDETGRRYLDVRQPRDPLPPRRCVCCCVSCPCLQPQAAASGCMPAALRARVPALQHRPRAATTRRRPAALRNQHGQPLRLRSQPGGPCCACTPQAFGGIVTVSVGHCHPEVNAAVIEQTQRLQVRCWAALHGAERWRRQGGTV